MAATKSRRGREIDARLADLLRRFGYRMAGDTLVSVGVRRYDPDTVVGRFRSVWAAAEWACPFVRDPAYTDELVAITAPAD